MARVAYARGALAGLCAAACLACSTPFSGATGGSPDAAWPIDTGAEEMGSPQEAGPEEAAAPDAGPDKCAYLCDNFDGYEDHSAFLSAWPFQPGPGMPPGIDFALSPTLAHSAPYSLGFATQEQFVITGVPQRATVGRELGDVESLNLQFVARLGDGQTLPGGGAAIGIMSLDFPGLNDRTSFHLFIHEQYNLILAGPAADSGPSTTLTALARLTTDRPILSSTWTRIGIRVEAIRTRNWRGAIFVDDKEQLLDGVSVAFPRSPRAELHLGLTLVARDADGGTITVPRSYTVHYDDVEATR